MKNVLFLVSQPRAGSTLLQRILGGHPSVLTCSEPWLLLPPVHALRRDGHRADYNADFAWQGLHGFLGGLKNGRKTYAEGVRRMYGHLYDTALEEAGKKVFLDKTPRYYLILKELMEFFPEARILILLRNPLAVLASVICSWVKGDWEKLANNGDDLLVAPKLLADAMDCLGNRGEVIRYEQLVKDPEATVGAICGRLGLSFEKDMVEYGDRFRGEWVQGDQTTVEREDRPVADRVDRWREGLEDPQYWRCLWDYLLHLGRDLTGQLGYDFDEMSRLLKKDQPFPAALEKTRSLKELTRSGIYPDGVEEAARGRKW